MSVLRPMPACFYIWTRMSHAALLCAPWNYSQGLSVSYMWWIVSLSVSFTEGIWDCQVDNISHLWHDSQCGDLFISVMCMHQQCWWTAIAVLTNQIMFFYIYRYFEAGIILYLWFRVMILQGEKWPETFETFILRLHFVNLLIFVPYVKHGSDPTHCCDPFWKWCMSWWSKFGKHSCWFYMKISDQIRSQFLHIASQLSWFIDIQSMIWRTQPKYTKTINCRFKTWMKLV